LGGRSAEHLLIAGRKILKAFFDVAFRFEIVNGRPVVRSDAPHGATVQP
jgi:hypothetical protein